MSISRRRPPIVRQTHADSCWAAVLESWSIVDGHIPRQHQQALINQWGEGGTGGITPLTKIPVIASALGLQWGGFPPESLVTYLEGHLPRSHVFCAYTRGAFTHAILIYRFSDRNNISYMDPDGGHDRWKDIDWFLARGPYVLMRRP
ncbi:MAG: hypothetical protein ACM369_01945 [Acidobacteriota bacterium]|jgi:hypothetical protein